LFAVRNPLSRTTMIRLTFLGDRTPARSEEWAPYYRVTGGVIWTQPDRGPLATFSDNSWKSQEILWSGLRFEGPCRLILGLPRAPISVSEQLQSVAISGSVLSANGLPIAVYDPTWERWQGASAGSTWPAFRIETAGLRDRPHKPGLRGDLLFSIPHSRTDQ
jgi:hypothetical protein